jgi:hypothetical protein
MPSHSFSLSPISHFSLSCAGTPHCRSYQCQRRSPVPLQEIPVVGSRYGKLCQPTELENLPPAGRALVNNSLSLFARADRGVVCNANNKTMDGRAAHFCNWLAEDCGFLFLCCAQSITPSQAVALVGAYVLHVMNTPINKHGTLPMANTLSHHAQLASTFLCSIMSQPFSIYVPGGSKPKLLPTVNR